MTHDAGVGVYDPDLMSRQLDTSRTSLATAVDRVG